MAGRAQLPDFDRIYSIELVYVPECWTLCGDAHCCSFSRYKARFRLIAQQPYQELPLLPGEYEFLERRGWLAQFGDHDHRVNDYPLGDRVLRAESIVSRRPNCACDHATRTTICRLYPLLPVFEPDGRVVGVDSVGIYEAMEEVAGIERACQVTAAPFPEMQKFLDLCGEIARSPAALFSVMAYRIVKEHVRSRLEEAASAEPLAVFSLFERLLLRRQLIDHDQLRPQLLELLGQFQRHYGNEILPAAVAAGHT